MEIEGTIVLDLGQFDGVSKAGRPWKKHEWVLETGGMYPRKVKFHVFGDRADNLNFQLGNAYALTFEIESREFNGRWYTDINVLGARELPGGMAAANGPQFGQAQAPQQAAPAFNQPQTPPFGQAAPAADPFAGSADNTDDLPF